MANSVNKVILIGFLGKDPESRSMQSGDKVVSFSLATSETWNDKASGEKKSKVEWHNVVIWNDRIADVAEKYLRKGSHVYVEGALSTRKWTDKDGNDKYTTEVVLQRFRGELTMLGAKDDGGDAREPAAPARQTESAPRRAAAPSRGTADDDLDDQIPF
jgi:single-strand DNA-binding protein